MDELGDILVDDFKQINKTWDYNQVLAGGQLGKSCAAFGSFT